METTAFPSFPVDLVSWVSSTALRSEIRDVVGRLPREEKVFGRSECFNFSAVKNVRNREKAVEAIGRFPRGPHRCLIVISDKLATDDRKPTEFAGEIRRLYLETEHLVGLIAVVRDDRSGRVTDIDHTVAADEGIGEKLRDAIRETARGLWLKAPPTSPPPLGDGDAISIRLAQSPEELAECLRLRFRVYHAMRYLEDAVTASGAEMELDCYDARSLHFVAVDHASGTVVGTARLVTPNVSDLIDKTIIGMPWDTLRRHGVWCKGIANELAQNVLRRRLRLHSPAALPILRSCDFGKKWPRILEQAMHGAELSRLVVAPEYQGLGISRLLVRAVIATALDIRKEFLMLECVPIHVRMYASYGFQRLEGHHFRAQELDQRAIGMQLSLEDAVDNKAIAVARVDIGTIAGGLPDPNGLFGTKHLCLCNDTYCWRDARYEFRAGASCPLRALHSTRGSSVGHPR